METEGVTERQVNVHKIKALMKFQSSFNMVSAVIVSSSEDERTDWNVNRT